MANAWHVEWLKEGVKPWNKRRKRVVFRPDLSGVNFFDLLPEDFRDDPKTSRFFESINLSDADLMNADLSRLNFSRAKFDRSTLLDADLTRSNFEQASFRFSDLRNVIFEGSRLEDAQFESTTINGVSFENSDLSTADFISTDLAPAQRNQLEGVRIREFATRAEYRDATQVLRSLRPYQETDAPPRSDERPKKNSYEVFFGTTRKPVFARGVVTDYNTEQWPQTSYGIAEIVVPEGNRLGGIGRQLWKRLVNRQASDLRLRSIITLNEELFFSVLKKVSVEGGAFQRPTVFVHGYNTSFKGALLRAAQFGHDLGIAQGIGLFSWPSKETELQYPSDEASAERNKYALAEFLEKFIRAFPDQGVSVVAHSMGCRCLLGAIEVLSSKNGNPAKSIHQVVLAAADVDAAIMPMQGAATVSNADRATSYVGDRDKALKLSRWIHSLDRVGLVPPAFTMHGLDTVLVNDADLGAFSHGYIGNSRAVLADVHALLTKNEDPSIRFSVRQTLIEGIQIWKLAD